MRDHTVVLLLPGERWRSRKDSFAVCRAYDGCLGGGLQCALLLWLPSLKLSLNQGIVKR